MVPALPRAIAAVMVALLVVGGTLHVVATALPPPGGDADLDPEQEFIRIELHPNASATWTIEYTYRLTGNRSAAFDDLQADIRSNRSKYRNSFRRTVGESVSHAENATGREMAMRDVSVRTRRQTVGSPVGIVAYRFRWTNFSKSNGSRLQAGDAISGLLLDERTRLEIAWPTGYERRSVSPSPPDEQESGAVAWTGPKNFADDEPRLELVRTNGTTATAPTASGSRGPAGTAGSGPSGAVGPLGTTGLALAGAVFVLLGSLAWVARHRGGDVESEPGDDEAIPAELLSNEELALRTLREHDGRMKQRALRDEVGWAAPKTSKVLGDLQEDGRVEVFRLGRENVVTLPDVGLEDDTDE